MTFCRGLSITRMKTNHVFQRETIHANIAKKIWMRIQHDQSFLSWWWGSQKYKLLQWQSRTEEFCTSIKTTPYSTSLENKRNSYISTRIRIHIIFSTILGGFLSHIFLPQVYHPWKKHAIFHNINRSSIIQWGSPPPFCCSSPSYSPWAPSHRPAQNSSRKGTARGRARHSTRSGAADVGSRWRSPQWDSCSTGTWNFCRNGWNTWKNLGIAWEKWMSMDEYCTSELDSIWKEMDGKHGSKGWYHCEHQKSWRGLSAKYG